MNDFMKFLFSFVFCLLTFCVSAQEEKLLLDVKGLPVRDGKIFKFESKRTYCGMTQQDGIIIESKTDSVFSNIDGIVSFAGEIGGDYAVIIKTEKSVFLAFSQIRNTAVKRNDRIKKGDFVGLIKLDGNNLFSLFYLVCNSKGVTYSEAKTIDFIMEQSKFPCPSNNQPIVAR